MSRERRLLLAVALVLAGVATAVWAVSDRFDSKPRAIPESPGSAAQPQQQEPAGSSADPGSGPPSGGGDVGDDLGQALPGVPGGGSSPPTVSRYMAEVRRYGLGVAPASRSPVEWELEFRSPRDLFAGGARVVADQNATRLSRHGTAVARIDVTGAPVAAPGPARVYSVTGRGTRTTVAETPVHAVARQAGTRVQVAVNLGELQTSAQQVEVEVPLRIGDQEELVRFFFELFDEDGLAVFGPASDEVRDGHIVFNVSLRAAHRSRVRAVGRISTAEGEPVAMVRSEADVSGGAGSMQLWLSGPYVHDHMPAGDYILHDIELSQIGMGTAERPAVRWSGRYPFDVPPQVAWAATPPVPASQPPVPNGDIVRLP